MIQSKASFYIWYLGIAAVAAMLTYQLLKMWVAI